MKFQTNIFNQYHVICNIIPRKSYNIIEEIIQRYPI